MNTAASADPPAASLPQAMRAGWPQLQHDAARTGYTDDIVKHPAGVLWSVDFKQPGNTMADDFCAVVQPIVCNNRVFAGAKSGFMYCVKAEDGTKLWEFPADGPILHTAGCFNDTVIFGCMDGNVYAVGAADGKPKWKFSGASGFSTAPCIIEEQGIVMLGCRSGVFYALDAATGAKLWEYDAGAPVLNCAASDGALVYFGPEDMRIRALDASTGKEAWVSEPLYGSSMRGIHPVLHKGRVIARTHRMGFHTWTLPGFGGEAEDGLKMRNAVETQIKGLDKAPDLSAQSAGGDDEVDAMLDAIDQATGDIDYEKLAMFRLPEKYVKQQDTLVEWYTGSPENQGLFVLDAATGENQGVVPQDACHSLNGFMAPPAIDCEGLVVMQFRYNLVGWARLDVERLRAVDYLMPERRSNIDEVVSVSCGGPFIYLLHASESGGCDFTGSVDLRTREWFNLQGNPGKLWGLANVQPGNHAASVSGGRFFHITRRTLTARGGK